MDGGSTQSRAQRSAGCAQQASVKAICGALADEGSADVFVFGDDAEAVGRTHLFFRAFVTFLDRQ
jgi:hypothetical protein